MSIETVSLPAPTWHECLDLLQRLPEMPLDRRIEAVEVLMRNPSPGIRQQALRVGAAVLSDGRLTDFLRDESDAVRRSAGSEIFRLRGGKSLPVVVSLLADLEPDVVLQAVLILARMRDPRALEPLHEILGHEDVNVVQEALLAIGQLGDSRSVAHLEPFVDADPWVQLAAIQALGDLRAREAIPVLAAKLVDPLVSIPAAEALARIGGGIAFAALAEHWTARRHEADAEELLGLLAHVAEGLTESPGAIPTSLTSDLGGGLNDPSGPVRLSSARCLLATGPSHWDHDAVGALAGEAGVAADLPPCLNRRSDLVGALLEHPGKAQIWGLRLVARFPYRATESLLKPLLEAAGNETEGLKALTEAVLQARLPGLSAPLFDLYMRLNSGNRTALLPALEIHTEEMRGELATRRDLDPVEALVLSARLRDSATAIRSALLAFGPWQRRTAVSQLLEREDVVRSLPWKEWIASDPALTPVAAEAAARYRLTDLLPVLRQHVKREPVPSVLLALGDLRDQHAVPLFLRVLRENPSLRPVALECLGKIGNSSAREALRRAIALGGTEAEVRAAYRALAECADACDQQLFREVASHPDWYLRLVTAEVLARSCSIPENLAALTLLATDPVSVVAHRALRALEY